MKRNAITPAEDETSSKVPKYATNPSRTPRTLTAAKMLSGELITLEAKTYQQFCHKYLHTYVKKNYQPYTTVHWVDDTIVVNVHPTVKWFPLKRTNWTYLCLSVPSHFMWLVEENLESVDWNALSRNPAAVPLLEKNPMMATSHGLSVNPSPQAIELLKTKPHLMNWYFLSANPAAIHLLEANLDKVNWVQLSKNPFGLQLWEENLDKVDWVQLSANPGAIPLLEANPEHIDWSNLSKNPAAIHLLEENWYKIDWRGLSANPSPQAIEWLEENPGRIDWDILSENPAALHLLERNQGKVKKFLLCKNPALFCPPMDDF